MLVYNPNIKAVYCICYIIYSKKEKTNKNNLKNMVVLDINKTDILEKIFRRELIIVNILHTTSRYVNLVI